MTSDYRGVITFHQGGWGWKVSVGLQVWLILCRPGINSHTFRSAAPEASLSGPGGVISGSSLLFSEGFEALRRGV